MSNLNFPTVAPSVQSVDVDNKTQHGSLRRQDDISLSDRILATCPSTYSACTTRPTLKKSSYYVAAAVDLQCILNKQISAGLVVDGYFGDKTETAVRNWQSKYGLAVDGIVGPNTWSSLCTTTGTGTGKTLEIKKGTLTLLGESLVNYVYWPNTAASGVTLGIGYDVGSLTSTQVKTDLTSAGMGSSQASIISEAAGIKGTSAGTWVSKNKSRVGTISEEVSRNLFNKKIIQYEASARSRATSVTPDSSNINARSREVMAGLPLYTYVMNSDQWTNLHPAMLELIKDLVYNGGFYGYDRIAQINRRLILNSGNHLQAFKDISVLFGNPPPPTGQLSYMDQYGKAIGHGLGNTETFYGITSYELRGASTRRSRVRLAYLLHIIKILENGGVVKMIT